MDQESTGAFVSYLGLLIQAAGALTLLILFLLLRSHAQRRNYFIAWGNAWLGLSVALWSLVISFQSPGAAAWWVPAAYFLYQLGKLCFLALLLAGTLMYASGLRSQLYWLAAYGAAFGYAALGFAFTQDINALVVLQAPVAVAVMGACAWLLFALPAARRTLGSRATGAAFLLIGAFWALYFFAFQAEEAHGFTLEITLFGIASAYNSYFDLLLQTLLAFGMVLILLEDAKRETDAAHGELALAHEKLLTESYRDSLTGAFNRRAFGEGIGLEAARSTYGTVVVLDLDNLKDINDGHGHATGDEILRHLVAELRLNLRPSDKLYRMGGDEFLVVMPRSRAEAVVSRLDLLLKQAPRLKVETSSRGLRLKVSLGAADYTNAADLADAIRDADQRMYEVKRRHKETGELDTNPNGGTA